MSEIKVLQFSTHNEDCGIAKYQEQFIEGMSGANDFYTEYFPYSPNVVKNLPKRELERVVSELVHKMKDFDILHIQHELSFFKQSELNNIISVVRALGKKVIVTVHTAPAAQYRAPRLGGLGPRSLASYAKQHLSARRYVERYVEPLNKADLVIVHNNSTKQDLMSYGLPAEKIQIITIPVPKITHMSESHLIKEKLGHKKGDIIYCTVGFMSRMKRVTDAVKALKYLPDNYKLAIIGGMHPNSEDYELYNEITDLIVRLGLEDRIYITGYIEDDAEMNSLIRESDICVYPYDKAYYSYVSSAAINNAIANHKPIIAYPTKTFVEVNNEIPVVTFTKSPSYYELAREIAAIDISVAQSVSERYADRFAYEKEAKGFIEIYRSLLSR